VILSKLKKALKDLPDNAEVVIEHEDFILRPLRPDALVATEIEADGTIKRAFEGKHKTRAVILKLETPAERS
jgi:hypothetical protein